MREQTEQSRCLTVANRCILYDLSHIVGEARSLISKSFCRLFDLKITDFSEIGKFVFGESEIETDTEADRGRDE